MFSSHGGHLTNAMYMNTGAKEIQRVNPGGPDKQPKLKSQLSLSGVQENMF